MPIRRLTYSTPADLAPIRDWLAPRKNPGDAVADTVRAILADVRSRGDVAVAEYTAKFDFPGCTPAKLRIAPETIAAALDKIPTSDRAILEEAADNIRTFHQRQVENSWWTTSGQGTILGQMVTPVDRVGLYVPGGQGGETPLISSLLMNALPARCAGVEEIAVFSPPRKDGTLNPYILATAALLDIDEVYATGSAWAVATMAYGTDSIRPFDVIAGPGNIFVATAKSLLVGEVGIDMIAGPSEIAIVAGKNADPAWLAADMLSQAEHDPLAATLLVTNDATLADAVDLELETQCEALPRCEIAGKSLTDWSGAIITPDLDAAAELINAIAPEHLELAVDDPWALLPKVRHAGAVFMGQHCPEPVGDYFAGPNHVLPTLSTARFSSALSVQNFCKKTSVIATTPEYVAAHGDKIARLARLEGLEAHARSVEIRNKK